MGPAGATDLGLVGLGIWELEGNTLPSLVVERGQEKGFSYNVRPGTPVVVGRDPANEIIISDPAASRRHFQIRQSDSVWTVLDLGSRNRTYRNEEELTQEQALSFGDRIQVGETVFSFLEEDKTDEGKAKGLAGKDIGGYKILERIGRGGMGTVYKSRQISLNRICALKVLAAKFAKDPEFVQQFVAEARAAGQLQHPHVVQVLDVGQAGGLHFLSMELMDGGAVQDVLAQREDLRLPWTEAMPMVKDACQGLVFAEKHGIVHRDIKPDNLMLTSEGRVKLGDLGLAQRSDQESDGKIFGTPHFIAPEQARGKKTTGSADIYSLGATFYRMVSGRTPFAGQSVKEILRKQIGEPHVPLTEEVEDFPADLSAIVDKMMEKQVSDRYGSATELLEDLEAFELAHRMELSGLKKVNKPLLIAGAILIASLIGVVIWQVLKPKDVVTKTIKPEPEVIHSGADPAELAKLKQQQLETKAELAFARLGGRPPSAPISLDKEALWREKADRFDGLATTHNGTKAERDATKRANEIRAELTRLNDEYRGTIGAAKVWWDKEKLRIDAFVADQDWTQALATGQATRAGREFKTHGQHVPDATTYLDGLKDAVDKAVSADFDTRIAAAQKLFDNNDPRGAVQAMDELKKALDAHSGACAKIAALAASANDWIENKSQAVKVDLTEQLGHDRVLYITAARTVRAQGDELTDPFWAFDFEGAAKVMERESAGLGTWLYKSRAATRAERLRGMQASWEAFIAAAGSGQLIKDGEVLSDLPVAVRGAKSTLDLKKPPNKSEFRVDVALQLGSTAKRYAWADLTAKQVYDIFLAGRIDRIEPELALGLAWIFGEHGRAAEATALLKRAQGGGAGVTPEELAELQAELRALIEYQSIVDLGEDKFATALLRIDAWRDRHSLTETFVVIEGRPAAELPPLFSASRIDKFLDSWGKQ